jgi:hypothetical protein
MTLITAYKTIIRYASVTKDQAKLDRHHQNGNAHAKEDPQQHGTDSI